MTYSEYLDSLTPIQKAALNSFVSFMAEMIIKYYDQLDDIIKGIESSDQKND